MAIKIGKLFSANKLVGTGDDDTLIGGLFNDVLIGGAGKDRLNGGLGGTDTVDYSKSGAGVTVDLSMGRGTGSDAEGDTYESIENVVGSAFDDILIGNGANNTMTGGAGRDVFVRTAGYDTITDFKPNGEVFLIDFEGLNQAGVPNGYKGMTWNQTLTLDATLAVNPGYSQLLDFPNDEVGFRSFANPAATPSFSSQTEDFNLISLDISGGANPPLAATTIEAWDDNVVVGFVELSANASGRVSVDFEAGSATGTTAIFTGRFTSIDKVRFVDTAGASNNIAFDDIKIFGNADRIDVPVGTDIAALVASAVSDGQGGTFLTMPPTVIIGRGGVVYTSPPDGRLNLIGIDPGSVSADWFI